MSSGRQEVFCEYRDLYLQKRFKNETGCLLCGNKGHNSEQCPSVMYIAPYAKIYSRQLRHLDNRSRKEYVRRVRSRNSYEIRNVVASSVRNYKLSMLVKARPDFQNIIKQFIDEVSAKLDDQQFQISTGLLTCHRDENNEETILFNDNIDEIE